MRTQRCVRNPSGSMAAVLAGACAVMMGCGPGDKPSTPATQPALPTVAAVRVTTVRAELADMPRFTTLTGSIIADKQSDVAADVSGKLLSVPVERGAQVKAGAVLAVLDRRSANLTSRESTAQADLARTQADLAGLDCMRVEYLAKTGAVGQSEYEASRSRCKAAALALEAAQTRQEAALKTLGDSVIKAPFAGIVSERYVNVGEYVRPESRIVNLVAGDPVRAQILVPEQLVATVAAGMQVDVSVPAYPEQWFTGTVRYLGAALREVTRDLLVEASLPNPELKLRPGMFAVVRLHWPRAPSVVVPVASLRRDGTVARLFVEVDGRLQERVVELGVQEGSRVEVVRGVSAGEHVVSPVTAQAQDGARVAK